MHLMRDYKASQWFPPGDCGLAVMLLSVLINYSVHIHYRTCIRREVLRRGISFRIHDAIHKKVRCTGDLNDAFIF
jgi:hypothetical protein